MGKHSPKKLGNKSVPAPPLPSESEGSLVQVSLPREQWRDHLHDSICTELGYHRGFEAKRPVEPTAYQASQPAEHNGAGDHKRVQGHASRSR